MQFSQMKQQDWSNEDLIYSDSIEKVKKLYEENEEHVIWRGELYYYYCLRLHETDNFIIDWTLLHPTDYYKLKVVVFLSTGRTGCGGELPKGYSLWIYVHSESLALNLNTPI